MGISKKPKSPLLTFDCIGCGGTFWLTADKMKARHGTCPTCPDATPLRPRGPEGKPDYHLRWQCDCKTPCACGREEWCLTELARLQSAPLAENQ